MRMSLNQFQIAIIVFQASLMGDRESFEKIVKSNNPKECKTHGKDINPWNEELWQRYLCAITKDVVYSKFSQVEDLQKNLIEISKSLFLLAFIHSWLWAFKRATMHNHSLGGCMNY